MSSDQAHDHFGDANKMVSDPARAEAITSHFATLDRAHCHGWDLERIRNLITAFEDVAYQRGRGDAQKALRNCHMLARRKVRKDPDWKHILRFCEEVGVTSETGVLRDALTRLAEGGGT